MKTTKEMPGRDKGKWKRPVSRNSQEEDRLRKREQSDEDQIESAGCKIKADSRLLQGRGPAEGTEESINGDESVLNQRV